MKSYQKHVFFSNHSFETWLLNHVIFFSKPIIKQQEYNPYMNKHFGVKLWSKYKDANNRKIVMSKVDCKSVIKAKENVKKLDWNKPFDNPSCNMDKFIEKLLELNEKEKNRNND